MPTCDDAGMRGDRPNQPHRIVIAVGLSALVCPGAGQIYNRERRKGTALVAASIVAGVALTGFIVRNVLRALPEDILTLDALQIYDIARQAPSGPAVTLSGTALVVLWIYGVVDAYFVASRAAADAPASTISR
jgi:hypothetical protein